MPPSLRCARPGCGGVATAWLSYDYASQRVWLDDPGGDRAGHHSALCATHAGRLRPPQGWSFQDRRTARPVPSSAPPRPVASEAAPVPPAGPGSQAAAGAPSPAPGEAAGAEPGCEGGRPAGFTAIAV